MTDTLVAVLMALLQQGVSVPTLERAFALARAQTPVQGDTGPLRDYARALAQELLNKDTK